MIASEKDECIDWPFNKIKGYAACNGNLATRVICERLYGPAPSGRHEAAHSCGRGKFGCVTPKHLRWATPEENHADRITHGTSNRGERQGRSILTRDQVILIRAMSQKCSQRELAREFGVVRQTIQSIVHRRIWAWLE